MAGWFTWSLENEDSRERAYQKLLLHVLGDVRLLDRHAVGGEEKGNGRVSEREQSVSEWSRMVPFQSHPSVCTG